VAAVPNPLPEAAHADRLTDALRRSGALGEGRVCDVVVESSRPTIVSHIVRLRLTYEGGADAPNSLILKTGDPTRAGGSWDAGRQEVAFYSKVASAMEQRLTVRCYEAFWDAKTNDWRLLLEDLTDSHHIATKWPLPPTMEQCGTILRALARFQAAWWDDPRLGVSLGSRAGAAAISSWLGKCEEVLGRFKERVGGILPPERLDLFARWLRVAPRLLADFDSRRNITISHGDAHFWNAFLPREHAGDEVRFFDWDSWRIDVGTRDLAYAMAMHWYPDRRRLMEGPLLDAYHAELAAHGETGYSRRDLDEDYRRSALLQIVRPVWQESFDIPPVIWWNNLERALLAVDDLGCRDLFS
jgi:hypothetical protein